MGIVYFSGLALLVVTCVVAWLRGGDAERIGAALCAFAWITFILALPLAPYFGVSDLVHFRILLNLWTDMFLAIGLLVIALKFMSLWLGVAMWCQSLAFVLHSLMLDGDPTGSILYILAINVLSFLVLFCLLLGSIVSWRRRAQLKKNAVLASASVAAISAIGAKSLAPRVISV